jgi:hypothetical protein
VNKNLQTSSWKKIKDCINSYEVGDILKQQIIFKQIKGIPHSSVDGYRSRLQCLFILESAGVGKYRLLQKIPEQMNTVVLFALINEERWKHWFIPIQERVDEYFNKNK